jgi:hypothetical protein
VFSRHPAVRAFEVAVGSAILVLILAGIWIVADMSLRARREERRRMEIDMGSIPLESRPWRVDDPTRHPAPESLVSLFGGVARGGYFEPPPGRLTLAMLMAAGGGLSPAVEGEITVARKVGGAVEVVARVRVDDREGWERVEIRPGDVVMVPR